MTNWTKNKLSFIVNIIGLVIVTALSLMGPVISFIHQYRLIVEEFGKFIGGVFIYDSYAWWNLTALIWLPYGTYLCAYSKKANREATKEAYKLLISDKENKDDK